MRALRLLLAAALLAVAVVALLTAHDVRAWRSAFERGDARLAAHPALAVWRSSTILPGDPARSVLGFDDDRALRRAVRAYRVAERTPRGFDNGETQTRVARLPRSRSQTSRRSGAPAAASQAGNLLGVLVVIRAGSVTGGVTAGRPRTRGLGGGDPSRPVERRREVQPRAAAPPHARDFDAARAGQRLGRARSRTTRSGLGHAREGLLVLTFLTLTLLTLSFLTPLGASARARGPAPARGARLRGAARRADCPRAPPRACGPPRPRAAGRARRRRLRLSRGRGRAAGGPHHAPAERAHPSRRCSSSSTSRARWRRRRPSPTRRGSRGRAPSSIACTALCLTCRAGSPG